MVKITDEQLLLIRNAEDRYGIDYGIYENGKIEAKALFRIIKEQQKEITKLENELMEIDEDIRENYKPVNEFDPYDFYGVDESDFH